MSCPVLPYPNSDGGGNQDGSNVSGGVGGGGVDFVDGLEAVMGAGDAALKEGLCVYTYLFNKGMSSRYPFV